MAVFIVLLRAIGAGTHRIMSMAQWRDAAEAAGFSRAETYLASGNMIVEGDVTAATMTREMDRIVQEFGLGSARKAVVRTPAQLAKLVRANPFPDASAERPDRMGVYFFAGASPDFSWVDDYEGPERLHVEGKHLIVDYTRNISDSPKLPGLIEKRSGTATARNWNTLVGLATRSAARSRQI